MDDDDWQSVDGDISISPAARLGSETEAGHLLFPTDTSLAQHQVEIDVSELLQAAHHATQDESSQSLCFQLKRNVHISFLTNPLGIDSKLPRSFVSLDASKPWIIFWIFHSLDLLEQDLDIELKNRAVSTLIKCQDLEGGGFGGGPGQIPHLAATYAAVHALAIIGTEDAYKCIEREKLYSWLMSLKQSDGSFRMHRGGEIDVRGSYCALSVARLLNVLTPELVENVGEFIATCQTYEGGLGSIPGVEAHGGYTYCGLAAIEILQKGHLLDVDLLIKWAVSRQMYTEGGFQGRTNKLVDGCYSFWQGGIYPMLDSILARKSAVTFPCLMNREALQNYIIICCQGTRGGLIDKPKKHPDYYHTCYNLSGLSISQHIYRWDEEIRDYIAEKLSPHSPTRVSHAVNSLPATHPIHNIRFEKANQMIIFFQQRQ